MGKIIKDGYTFVAYANARLIRNIQDIPELKNDLIALSEGLTHAHMAQYARLLARHVLEIGNMERTEAVDAALDVNTRWLRGEMSVKAALEIAGALNDLARAEKDQVTVKALRALGQIAATPHVRWHPLVASEYAVVVVNLTHPNDLDKVREERETQIALMESARVTPGS